MAFVVLYDACVLYPAPLRDLLVRIANTGIVRARWSEAILDECFRSILEQRPDLKPDALKRTRELMKQAVPDCLVTGFEALVEGLALPDPDDRHVLAAAIQARAQAIITFNLRPAHGHPSGTGLSSCMDRSQLPASRTPPRELLRDAEGTDAGTLLCSRVMARATVSAAKIQAKALRVLADEIESGRRRPSPELSRVLANEIEAPDSEEVSPEEWARAWGAEIDRRLARAKEGRAKRRDLGAVLEGLRARR